LFELLLFIGVVTLVILALYAPSTVGYKEYYSYMQHHEPEDAKRVETVPTHKGSALSKFEIPHYMGDSMSKLGPSDQFERDPGYFLGNTVI